MALLIGVFTFGAAVAALLYLRGGRSLGFSIGAGLAAVIVAAAAWDYLWYPLQKARLPASEVPASVTGEANPLRPWTMALPATIRFVTVDTNGARRHGAALGERPGERIVPLTFRSRYEADLRVEVLFDCVGLRRAPLVAGVALEADGTVSDPDWTEVTAADPVFIAACDLDLPPAG